MPLQEMTWYSYDSQRLDSQLTTYMAILLEEYSELRLQVFLSEEVDSLNFLGSDLKGRKRHY